MAPRSSRAGTVLLARKNLVFDSMTNEPIQAEYWLCGAVVRLLLKGCGKEDRPSGAGQTWMARSDKLILLVDRRGDICKDELEVS
eukprot:Skav222614  [mRNA]  locus=scaffold1190:81877:82674:+ [translate_table: standard]